jgi:tetratricopeptide (TPR) repeat protein
VAAAVSGDSGELAQPVALPERLAELLVARAARCGAGARALLNTLAVAGRPLTENMLGEVTDLEPGTVWTAVRELTAARLLAPPSDGAHRPRHALLAEAVSAELLPGERVALHERVARALESTGDETLAAEAAGHWATTGRSGEELRARLTAATAAEQVFAYADAAAHWQRAIELCQVEPAADLGDEVNVPQLYIRAVDALEASGDRVQAAAGAEEAYLRFADHPDRATAGSIHLRAGLYRGIDSPAARLLLVSKALGLFEGTPPSAEYAQAWLRHAKDILVHNKGRHSDEVQAAVDRALEIAEAAGAATLRPQILSQLADYAFDRGEIEDGFRLLAQAQSDPKAFQDAWSVLWSPALKVTRC